MSNINIQVHPQVLVLYSNNVVCYEQGDMIGDIRTLVLICCKDVGYLVIAKKGATKGYVTLKRWKIDTNASVSFHLPSDMPYKLDVRMLQEMERRYQFRPRDWSGIATTTRYNGIMAIARGTT